MVDFGYNNNAIRNQTHFKPITNGNVADSKIAHPSFSKDMKGLMQIKTGKCY